MEDFWSEGETHLLLKHYERGWQQVFDMSKYEKDDIFTNIFKRMKEGGSIHMVARLLFWGFFLNGGGWCTDTYNRDICEISTSLVNDVLGFLSFSE